MSSFKQDIFNFPYSIQNLIRDLSQTPYLTCELVKYFITKAEVKEKDLLPWANYNHPITHSYGRKLVYDGGYFEIMVMSWLSGDISAIHDHGYTQWGAVKSFGKAKHIIYKLKNNVLQTQKEMWLKPNQIVKVNHDLIHQMGNMSDSRFLSLHIYGCHDRKNAITSDARIFDLFEGSIQYTNGGVFFCLPDEEITQKSYKLQGDLKTTLQHHQQMLARIQSILGNSSYKPSDWQLKAKLLEDKISKLL